MQPSWSWNHKTTKTSSYFDTLEVDGIKLILMCSPTVAHHYHLFCRIEWSGMRIYIHTTLHYYSSRLLHRTHALHSILWLKQKWWSWRREITLHIFFWIILVMDFRLYATHHNIEFCAISFHSESEVLDTLYNMCCNLCIEIHFKNLVCPKITD